MLVVGAIGLGAAIYLWKRHSQKIQEETEKAKETEGGPYIAGVTNPEEEYPYSIGGGYGGGGGYGAIAQGQETESLLREFFGESKQERKQEKVEREQEEKSTGTILEGISRQISAISQPGNQSTIQQGSGGGASSESKKGVTVAPTTPQDRCGAGVHAGFPNGTPPDCWRVSRSKTSGGCECHGHQNGHLECQTGKAPHCVWP